MAAAAAAPAFTAVLHGKVALEGVSAASGLEIAPDGVTGYVPGDDSVFLYQISVLPGGAGARVERKLRMADSKDVDKATGAVLTEEGIPKKVKPDFEAIALLPLGPAGAPRLTVFGSGSKAGLRDGISCLDPLTGAVDRRDGSALMSALRGDARVTGAAKLNLEAAALVGADTVALFNRGNTPGSANSVVLLDAAALRDHLAGGSQVPPYAVVHLTLPPISHGGAAYGAGVSGASTVVLPSRPGRSEAGRSEAGQSEAGQSEAGQSEAGQSEECLLISASYEATLNEIDDGDVLGSRLALLPAAAAAGPPP